MVEQVLHITHALPHTSICVRPHMQALPHTSICGDTTHACTAANSQPAWMCASATTGYNPRYIYVQLVHTNDSLVRKCFGTNVKMAAVVFGTDGTKRLLKVKVMDRGDGTFMGQYYYNRPAKEVHVKLKIGTAHVGGSPYVLKGPLSAEGCRCPRAYKQFVADYTCSGSDPARQIDADMQTFPNGLTRADFDAAIARMNRNSSSLVHFAVKGNKIYSQNHGQYGGFQKFINEILLSLARKVQLPDMEFLLNMGDWPQSARYEENTNSPLPPMPVFSWCGSDTHYDMVLPTYKLVQATVFGKDLENVQEIDGQSHVVGGAWDTKQSKVYFRGRPSNAVRINAMQSTRNDPDMDIRITKNHFNYFPNDAAREEHRQFEKKYGPKASRDSFAEGFKNKYQLNIDGTVAAYRLPALIAGNAVVFKQDSDYYEHFYKVRWRLRQVRGYN